MSRLVLSSIRSQRSAVPNYRGGCVFNNKFRDDTNLHRYPSLFEMTHSNSKVVD